MMPATAFGDLPPVDPTGQDHVDNEDIRRALSAP
jgi:hypothetical protein